MRAGVAAVGVFVSGCTVSQCFPDHKAGSEGPSPSYAPSALHTGSGMIPRRGAAIDQTTAAVGTRLAVQGFNSSPCFRTTKQLLCRNGVVVTTFRLNEWCVSGEAI